MLGNIVESQAAQFITNEDIKTSLKPDFMDIDPDERIGVQNRINSLMLSFTASNKYIKNYAIIGKTNGIFISPSMTSTGMTVKNLDQLKAIPFFDSFLSAKKGACGSEINRYYWNFTVGMQEQENHLLPGYQVC